MKVAELEGALLDYWVARAEGWTLEDESLWRDERGKAMNLYWRWNPSNNWAHGGPIIEREQIELTRAGNEWAAYVPGMRGAYGPAVLIAAMRAYVASKFGDTVEDS